MILKNPFRTISAHDLCAQQLEQARVDLLTHAHRREYHAAMEVMLRERIGRLGQGLQPAAERSRRIGMEGAGS